MITVEPHVPVSQHHLRRRNISSPAFMSFRKKLGRGGGGHREREGEKATKSAPNNPLRAFPQNWPVKQKTPAQYRSRCTGKTSPPAISSNKNIHPFYHKARNVPRPTLETHQTLQETQRSLPSWQESTKILPSVRHCRTSSWRSAGPGRQGGTGRITARH